MWFCLCFCVIVEDPKVGVGAVIWAEGSLVSEELKPHKGCLESLHFIR